MSMVMLKMELFRKLSIDSLNDLAGGIEQGTNIGRDVNFLIVARQGHQGQPISALKFSSNDRAEIGLVAQYRIVGMRLKQFRGYRQVGGIGRSQNKIQDNPTQCDHQMQLVAKNGELLGRNLAEGRTVDRPFPRCPWHQMKVDHWHRQAVNSTMTVLRDIQQVQNHASDQVNRLHQAPSPPIKATLRGKMGKQ